MVIIAFLDTSDWKSLKIAGWVCGDFKKVKYGPNWSVEFDILKFARKMVLLFGFSHKILQVEYKWNDEVIKLNTWVKF